MSKEVTAEQTSGQESGLINFEAFQSRDNQFHTGSTKPPEKKAEPVKPVTPEKEAEAVQFKKEVKEATPEKEADSDPIEKRLKDKDRYITQQNEELKKAKMSLSQLNKLIHKFGSDSLVYDADGNPIDFKFDDAKPKVEQKKEDKEPPLPTGDEEPAVYTQMLKDRAKWEFKQEMKAEREEQEARENAEKQKKMEAEAEAIKSEAINESWDMAKTLFPDMEKEDSPLRQKAEEIFRQNPKLKHRTDYNFICASMAAEALGIMPVTESTTTEKPKKEVKIVQKQGLSSLGGNSGKSDFHPINGKLDEFMQREKQFYKK